MQFDPFGEAAPDVIERERALHVTSNLHALPGGQVVVNLPAGLADLLLHGLDLGLEVDLVFVRMILQILEAALQFQNRLFKIERLNFHR